MNRRAHLESGLSMVELLISMAIGVVILSGLVNIFIGQKSSYVMQEGLSRVQENGRFAQHIIEQDLRMAGLLGCNTVSTIPPENLIIAPTPVQTFSNDNVIQGYQGQTGSWSPNIPIWITANIEAGQIILPGTDVITIRRMAGNAVPLAAAMATENDSISVPDQVAFKEKDVLFITDCETTDIFKATLGTTNTDIKHSVTLNATSQLTKAYQLDAYVGRLEVETYYVRTSSRTNAMGNPIPVLVRQDAQGNETELVDGVENLKIEYGLDTNGDRTVDTFARAAAITNNNQWSQVVSVRVSQLVNSVDEISPTPHQYTFEGTTITPNDRLYRRQWDAFIALRNRVL